MLLTEASAKKKWCPFAMTPVTLNGPPTRNPIVGQPPIPSVAGAIAVNRTDSGKPYAGCLASGCMSWRVTERTKTLSGTETETVEELGRPPERLGFCGLAGDPR